MKKLFYLLSVFTIIFGIKITSFDSLAVDDSPAVKGIYVSGPMAGTDNLDNLIELIDSTELNTVVIDVKNDDGQITYNMELEALEDTGACTSFIGDADELIEKLKEHNIYTIARVVCFKDPILAVKRPDLALLKKDGTPVTDGNGLAWVNPYNTGVWKYIVDIACKAAEDGFDEVQFDYVRFPVGSDANQASYGVAMNSNIKRHTIQSFLKYAVHRLHNEGITVSADVFGTIIGNEVDENAVGQDYAALCEIVDAISPMIYPSHYGPGNFGLAVPDAQPYETIKAAMEASVTELSGIDEAERAIVRPWLQAFTATWVEGHISYDGDAIRAQIQGLYDAGYEEWILWNAANRYSSAGLLSE
ncbi:MAG: putative glycoside hydrolase [Butyrivibrio sp.]|nr:putative glycoside hydrolase [Butyrivibrio sp.]